MPYSKTRKFELSGRTFYFYEAMDRRRTYTTFMVDGKEATREEFYGALYHALGGWHAAHIIAECIYRVTVNEPKNPWIAKETWHDSHEHLREFDFVCDGVKFYAKYKDGANPCIFKLNDVVVAHKEFLLKLFDLSHSRAGSHVRVAVGARYTIGTRYSWLPW